jgi:hypothetical protein
MSPIPDDSELGRLIAVQKELVNLLAKIIAITNSANADILTTKLNIKVAVAIIKKIKTMWSNYLQSVEDDRQEINQDLNTSIFNIVISGATIKNSPVNRQTLNSLISNINTGLKQQISRAIIQSSTLISIIDTRDRISLASNRPPGPSLPLPSRPVRLPSPGLPLPPLPPPPLRGPPMLQRRPNIGTQQTSLVRQQATHSLLEDLLPSRASSNASSTASSSAPRDGFGKNYFKARKLTHRKRGAKKPKTRRARK